MGIHTRKIAYFLLMDNKRKQTAFLFFVMGWVDMKREK